jgi:hypothetical protein
MPACHSFARQKAGSTDGVSEGERDRYFPPTRPSWLILPGWMSLVFAFGVIGATIGWVLLQTFSRVGIA